MPFWLVRISREIDSITYCHVIISLSKHHHHHKATLTVPYQFYESIPDITRKMKETKLKNMAELGLKIHKEFFSNHSVWLSRIVDYAFYHRYGRPILSYDTKQPFIWDSEKVHKRQLRQKER
jgi:hypothetical protein